MAPTFETTTTFDGQYKRLSIAERQAFKQAVTKMVEDLRGNKGFRRSLRIKRFQGFDGLFEVKWAPDGRALFAYGDEIRKGEPHIVWLQIGGHEIFKQGK